MRPPRGCHWGKELRSSGGCTMWRGPTRRGWFWIGIWRTWNSPMPVAYRSSRSRTGTRTMLTRWGEIIAS
uniref:Uncharacterized protein n=1 Tax=Arundo donax TaxID=35708 RepID=A0A0A9DTT0_ARUDO